MDKNKPFCASPPHVRENPYQAAHTLEFLRSPPGNQLEALKRDRAGQHSIRINRQWRLCFIWISAGPESVETVDYH